MNITAFDLKNKSLDAQNIKWASNTTTGCLTVLINGYSWFLIQINDQKVADHKYTVKKQSNDTYQVGKRKFKKIRVK